MGTTFKCTDKEGRIRLGQDYANQQWQINELENGAIVLIPMIPATSEDAKLVFDKVFHDHKKTIDALI